VLIFCFCYWKIIILKTVDDLIIANNRVVMEKNKKITTWQLYFNAF